MIATPEVAQLDVRKAHLAGLVLAVFVVDEYIAGFDVGVDATILMEDIQGFKDTPRYVFDLFPIERFPD